MCVRVLVLAHVCVCVGACLRACVGSFERERVWCTSVCVRVLACMCACVGACLGACVFACVSVLVWVRLLARVCACVGEGE